MPPLATPHEQPGHSRAELPVGAEAMELAMGCACLRPSSRPGVASIRGDDTVSNRDLSETDIYHRFISPALHQAGWLREQILREHAFTAGRITVRGRLVAKGKPRRADYVLMVGQVALAIIEAKDNSHAVGEGIQQALAYANAMHTPFVFASNGDAFVLHDRTGFSEQRDSQLSPGAFPGPEELWRRYSHWKGLSDDQ